MTNGRKILIADGDVTLLEMLSEQLQMEKSFITTQAETGAGALELMENQRYDAIILATDLPDMDGRDVCEKIRRNDIHSPVIMLFSPAFDGDNSLSLNCGASDYLKKPFRVGRLLEKLRFCIQYHEGQDDFAFIIGPYNFQPRNNMLLNTVEDNYIRLTAKETAILQYLYQAGNRIVGREVLLDKVWGYNPMVTTHTLETHVYRLRQKIEADPSCAKILVTEPGGYRLVC